MAYSETISFDFIEFLKIFGNLLIGSFCIILSIYYLYVTFQEFNDNKINSYSHFTSIKLVLLTFLLGMLFLFDKITLFDF